MELKKLKIGVLMGGLSREREVSLRSGQAVAEALKRRGYDVVTVDVGRDVAARLIQEKIKVACIMLHGRYGEDGTLQGLLEMMGIPYTGSGVLGSAVAMDKDITKRMVRDAGILTPDWAMILRDEVVTALPVSLPVIVKPGCEGSTIGMSIVREEKDFLPALQQAAGFDERILVEKFISGTEVTVGILNGKALPVLEIAPKSGFYDYTSKYTKGMTDYILPARIPEEKQKEISEITERVYSLLRLSGVARMDFMMDAKGKPFFLEANTIPGMTETSLVPKAAQAVGLSFDDLCEEILKGVYAKTKTA